MTTRRQIYGGETLAQKEMTRSGASPTGQEKTTSDPNSKPSDPLTGWFNLAKPSRNRQTRRGWQKGGRK